jgi:hypothetical protein
MRQAPMTANEYLLSAIATSIKRSAKATPSSIPRALLQVKNGLATAKIASSLPRKTRYVIGLIERSNAP